MALEVQKNKGHRRRLGRYDFELVEWVRQFRAATGSLVHKAVSDSPWDSHTQQRLTFLVREGQLRVFPRGPRWEPLVYFVDRNAVKKEGSLQHLLAINGVRATFVQAVRRLNFIIPYWCYSSELEARLHQYHLIPDSYWAIKRVTDRERISAFFLELQRANRDNYVIAEKLRKYHTLYKSGMYEELFGLPAMRVMFVFAAQPGVSTASRIKAGVSLASRLNAPFAYFAGLDTLTALEPKAALQSPVWATCQAPTPVSLYA